jgi:predicted membrane protein
MPAEGGDALLNVTAILGGFQRRVTSQDFRGGEVTAMFGGCELDLRDANIASEAVLTTFALCGGITVKVPIDWTVEMEGTPILGGFDEKTAVPKDRSKRLIVRGYAIMGGVEIRN